MDKYPRNTERLLTLRECSWELTGKGHATGGLRRACLPFMAASLKT